MRYVDWMIEHYPEDWIDRIISYYPCWAGFNCSHKWHCPSNRNSVCWALEMSEKDDEKQPETVDHPEHYQKGKFETIEEMRILFGDESVRAFCILNAYKYKARASYKGNAEEDLEKADWYLNYVGNMEKK